MTDYRRQNDREIEKSNLKLKADFDNLRLIHGPNNGFNCNLFDYAWEKSNSTDKGPEAKLGFAFPTKGMYDVLWNKN